MTIDYIQLSPTGNVTVLVTSPVPRALQPKIASRLLAPDCVGGEQAGFVEPSTAPGVAARLQMMGGEFCGNATMSLCAMIARDGGLADSTAQDYRLEVSGSDGPVPCRIGREGDAWIGTVEMPLPAGVDTLALDTDGGSLTAPIVRMPGIAHLILPAEAGLDEAQLRRRLPQWNEIIGADALGALTWNEAEGSIDPLVYVPGAGTLVREHGCGSGTAAIGCWLALKSGATRELPIRQPGGVITVRATVEANRITALSISGRVTVLGEGQVEVEI